MNTEHMEIDCPEIIRKSPRQAAFVGRLAVVALWGLMLWMGGVGSVGAQTIAPTSPCTYGPISPTGWTTSGEETPDCSTTTEWREFVRPAGTNTHPWTLGNVPVTPGGHSTFWTMVASPLGSESLSTTITGLQAGRSYNLNIHFNGNYARFTSGITNSACPALITINGVSTSSPAGPGNTWDQRSIPFVATGTSATLTIRAQQSPTTTVCQLNMYVGVNAVVPAVVDADLQMTKAVSPTGAVASGSVLTYTLVATNNGPSSATNVLLRDTPGAGLNCTTPSPSATCSASGGASCPGGTVPVSDLTGGGVTLPSLPVGGQVAVTMQCTVAATGR
jgi:uncharacterized repeat protein (TIGR01451 family)